MREFRRVVVVDDELGFIRECQVALQPRQVAWTTVAHEAAGLVESTEPDLVLVDLWLDNQPLMRGGQAAMGPVWGIDLLRDLRARFPDLLMVIVTGGYAPEVDRHLQDPPHSRERAAHRGASERPAEVARSQRLRLSHAHLHR